MKELKAKMILGGLTLLMATVYLFVFSNTPLFQPDSSDYINFSPMRPIGYPLFLWILKTLTGSYGLVPYLQLSLYFSAAFYCALNFYRLSQSLLLSAALIFGISLNVAFIKLSSSILTDVLGGGFLLLFLGMVFSFLHRADFKKIYGLWVIIGLACLIRPVFYCLIGALPFLCFMKWSFFRENILQRILLPSTTFLLLLGLGSFGQYINHGFFKTESFLGNNLIGKTGLIADPKILSNHPSIMHSFGKKSAEIRKILDKAPSLRIRYLLSVPYYDNVRFSFIPTLIPSENSDTFSKNIALEVIRERPYAYITDAFMNYCALWQLWDFYSFEEGKEFGSLLHTIASEEPLQAMYGKSSIRAETNQKFGNSLIVKSVRGALALAFILSLSFPLTFLIYYINGKPLSPVVLGGAVTGVAIQSGYTLTSLLQAGIARYALLFWPCVIILLTIFLKLVLNNLKFKE